MASWRVWSANTLKCYTLCYGEQRVLCRSDGPMPMSWQCIITIGNDGAGTVTSVGMGSTGVRENTSTPWVWLRKNQRKVIANGTMVSLDINNPEGHVFTLCQVVENKRQRVRVVTHERKGELLIHTLILARSYSHAHTRTLILARSYSHAHTRTV
jgi:hypothetical protein